MKSTFSRALLGFSILIDFVLALGLVSVVLAIAFVEFRATGTYTFNIWALLLVTIIILIAAGIYGLTLHRSIMDWKKLAKEKARFLEEANVETRRKETAATENN